MGPEGGCCVILTFRNLLREQLIITVLVLNLDNLCLFFFVQLHCFFMQSCFTNIIKYNLNISKFNFRTVQSAVTMKIGGIDCVLQSVTDTQVVCVTGARNAGSIDTKVELQINGGGNAQQVLEFDW